MVDGRHERFYWNTPEDVLAVTHGGQTVTAPVPQGIATLKGTNIENFVVVLGQVRNGDGDLVGTLSELEVFSKDKSTTLYEVYLTIVVAGRGSLFAYETKDYANPALMGPYQEMMRTGKPWEGKIEAILTAGPASGAKGILVGATGEFEGMIGFQQQSGIVTEVTQTSSKVAVCEAFWLHSRS